MQYLRFPAIFRDMSVQHIRPRGLAGGFAEVSAEVGRTGEMEESADLLHAVRPVFQERLRLGNDALLDKQKRLFPGNLADDAGQVFRGDAQLPGVVVQVAVLQAGGLDQADEVLRDGHFAGNPGALLRPFHDQARQAAAHHLGRPADDVVLEIIVRAALRHVDENFDEV